MTRLELSLALGEIRDDHILLGLWGAETAAAPHRSPVRIRSRRALALLIAAALLALAVTAYAAGWLDSLFGRAAEEIPLTETETDLFQSAAETGSDPAPVPLRNIPGHVFTLSESYYDGESLLLAYRLDSLRYPVEFGYGPGGEHFEDLWPLGIPYINAGWADCMTPEEYARVENLIREEDHGGFAMRYIYIGDHVRLSDGTDLGQWRGYELNGSYILEWLGEDREITLPDGSVTVTREAGLPAAARNLDELTLVFTVRDWMEYYYKDGSVFYYYGELLQEETVTVTVPRNG